MNKVVSSLHAWHMNTQHQIKRTLSQISNIKYLRNLLASNEFASRSELANQVCKQVEFFNPKGQEQRSGCMKALRELEAVGQCV